MSTSPQDEHPPEPRLALAIGVVGHRPNRLSAAAREKVEAEVKLVLDGLANAARSAHQDHQDLFTDQAPLLSVVSALAEGADTIVAQAALDRPEKDFVLDAPLPFPTELYRGDFVHVPPDGANEADKAAAAEATRRALETFEGLVDHERKRAVLELPGKRDYPGGPLEAKSYEAAGLTVLSQSDILIAIWDGGASAGRGGTTELVQRAARAGMPIIHVDATGQNPPILRWRDLVPYPAAAEAVWDLPQDTFDSNALRLVDEVIRLPTAPSERHAFERFRKEEHRKCNLRIEYPILTSVLFVRLIGRGDIRQPPPHDLAAQYAKFAQPAATAFEKSGGRTVAQAYGWADAVGVRFAQVFRSAFVTNFALAALAVVAASASVIVMGGLGSLRADWWLKALIVMEITLIGVVLINTIVGLYRHWHRRWFEAREVAERLRVALPLWALGLQPAAFPGEEPTWTGWYARAFVRMQALRHGELDPGGLSAAREILMLLLHDQCGYNERNAQRMHKMERRLERIGLTFFIATALVALDHLTGEHVLHCVLGFAPNVEAVAIWLSAALPAIATATYGIRVIGDFEGAARRSERTHAALDRLIKAVQQDPLDLGLLRARAHAAADAMLGDVASWRLSAESRGLNIPG